jgi:hypothetical protein
MARILDGSRPYADRPDDKNWEDRSLQMNRGFAVADLMSEVSHLARVMIGPAGRFSLAKKYGANAPVDPTIWICLRKVARECLIAARSACSCA